MKVFVDMRGSEIEGIKFAWWDTVTDRFEEFEGEQGWDSWDEFWTLIKDTPGVDIARFHSLCPNWVFEL